MLALQLCLCVMLSLLVESHPQPPVPEIIRVFVTFLKNGGVKSIYALDVNPKSHFVTLKKDIIRVNYPDINPDPVTSLLLVFLKRQDGNIELADSRRKTVENCNIIGNSQLYAFWEDENQISCMYMQREFLYQQQVNNAAGPSTQGALRPAQQLVNNEAGPSTQRALRPAQQLVNNAAGPSTQRALRRGRPRINNRAGPSISFTVTFIVNGMDYHTYRENISSGSHFSTLKSHILKTCFPLYSDDLQKDLTVYLKGVEVCTELAGIRNSLSTLQIVENSQLYAFWRVEYDMSYQYMLGQLQPQPPVNNEAGPSNDLTLRLAPPLVDDEAGPNINLTL